MHEFKFLCTLFQTEYSIHTYYWYEQNEFEKIRFYRIDFPFFQITFSNWTDSLMWMRKICWWFKQFNSINRLSLANARKQDIVANGYQTTPLRLSVCLLVRLKFITLIGCRYFKMTVHRVHFGFNWNPKTNYHVHGPNVSVVFISTAQTDKLTFIHTHEKGLTINLRHYNWISLPFIVSRWIAMEIGFSFFSFKNGRSRF